MADAAKKLSPEHDIVAELQSFSFFKNFPDHLIGKMAEIAYRRTFSDGEKILRQGQINENLYLLSSGKVDVCVDDKHVATLGQPGDVIGEMSLINSEPCAASIIAKGNVEAVIFSSRDFKNFEGEDQEKFNHLLYRIYSNVLAQKLRLTNEKAKYFEEMSQDLNQAKEKLEKYNVQLEKEVADRTADLQKKTEDLQESYEQLEQQNFELSASYKKIEELYASKEVTFSKLEDLYKNHLTPLQFTLDDLWTKMHGPDREIVTGAQKEVTEVMELLEPITSLHLLEKAMKSKKMLFVESKKKQQVIAKMAVGGSGVELDLAASLEEAEELLNSNRYDVVFFDTGLVDVAPLVKDLNPHAEMVCITAEAIPEYLPKINKYPFINKVISRDEEDRTFTIKNIMTTLSKLISGDSFGIDKYLAWGVEIPEMAVTDSGTRGDLIDQMDEYFQNLGIRRTVVERAHLVAEELLMNAIYDAPVDKEGRSLFNHLSRQEPVNLNPDQYSQLRYASDGMLIAVSVEDPFGALTSDIILKYLDSCYGNRAGELNKNKGGAGRGLHQIIENSDLVVFNIRPGEKTEVISLINVDQKSANVKYPSFHLFIS